MKNSKQSFHKIIKFRGMIDKHFSGQPDIVLIKEKRFKALDFSVQFITNLQNMLFLRKVVQSINTRHKNLKVKIIPRIVANDKITTLMFKGNSKRFNTKSVTIVSQPLFENFHKIFSLPNQSLSALNSLYMQKRGTDYVHIFSLRSWENLTNGCINSSPRYSVRTTMLFFVR